MAGSKGSKRRKAGVGRGEADTGGERMLPGERKAVEPGFAALLVGQLDQEDFPGVLFEKGEAGEVGPFSVTEAIRLAPPPQESLDLHGNTAEEAELRLTNFLDRARHHRLRSVLVITGRGLHSPAGSVLREVVETQLRLMRQDGTILAFRWEKRTKERSGAVIVYLP
ncbi:MAG: Smr/MutS family protein [Thermodesulfobacteriota bacterium]